MPHRKLSSSRRRFLEGAALGATALALSPRRASAQAKPTVTYWNGLTGADGKIMDELIDHFTRDTGIRMEQQRIVWADLYAKMQVAGLAWADGKPKIPTTREEVLAMAKQITKGDTFGFAIGTTNPGRYTWGFHNLLWQNGANVYSADLKRSGLGEPAALEVAEF